MTLGNSSQRVITSAVVLAGGLGTRLRPVYNGGPKSMAPVAGRPFLEYLLVWLHSAGITEVVMCVGYRRSQIERHFGRGARLGIDIHYAVEYEPRGTAGALKVAEPVISAPNFFVLNGDSFLDVDLGAMARFHAERDAVATIALAEVEDAGRYGSVSLEEHGRITGFTEKAEESLALGRGFINGGVYILSRPTLGAIPAGRAVSIEREVFPALAGKGLFGFPSSGYFVDIGVPDDFTQAQVEFPRRFHYDHPG